MTTMTDHTNTQASAHQPDSGEPRRSDFQPGQLHNPDALPLVVLYPLIYVVSASFSDGAAVIAGKVVLWPVDFSLAAYEKIFAYERIWTGYANSSSMPWSARWSTWA